jgi:hypothetical protein
MAQKPSPLLAIPKTPPRMKKRRRRRTFSEAKTRKKMQRLSQSGRSD